MGIFVINIIRWIILIKRYHVNTQKALLTIDGKPFVVEHGKEDKIIIDELLRTWNYWTHQSSETTYIKYCIIFKGWRCFLLLDTGYEKRLHAI